jgi:hypothetical protein
MTFVSDYVWLDVVRWIIAAMGALVVGGAVRFMFAFPRLRKPEDDAPTAYLALAGISLTAVTIAVEALYRLHMPFSFRTPLGFVGVGLLLAAFARAQWVMKNEDGDDERG